MPADSVTDDLPSIDPDQEALYNLRALRPDLDSVTAEWEARSAIRRAAQGSRLDLAYGAGERDRLDYFDCGTPGRPLLVYIHGGYWQRGDKTIYSFVADAFLERGINLALVNYDLCPAVRIGAIAPQVARALTWLWRESGDLGFDREALHLTGHSAGGHLTALLLTTDWPALDPALPANLVRSGVPISGLYDLEPLRHTSLNQAVAMDVREAEAASPLFHQPRCQGEVLLVVGGGETQAFHDQAAWLEARWKRLGCSVSIWTEPEVDHFDVVNRLADGESELFRRVLAQVV